MLHAVHHTFRIRKARIPGTDVHTFKQLSTSSFTSKTLNRRPWTLLTRKLERNVGALRVRIDFGVYYTIAIIRNPQNPILIFEAPTLKTPKGPGVVGFKAQPSFPWSSCQTPPCQQHLPVLGPWSQRLQYLLIYLLIKEYTLNYRRIPNMI